MQDAASSAHPHKNEFVAPKGFSPAAHLQLLFIDKVMRQSLIVLCGLASRERSPVQLESQQLCKEWEIIMKGPGGGWDDHGNLQLGNFLANPNRFCPLFEPLA